VQLLRGEVGDRKKIAVWTVGHGRAGCGMRNPKENALYAFLTGQKFSGRRGRRARGASSEAPNGIRRAAAPPLR
jgi:hypothetical protein